MNHPHAGKDLTFEGEVVESRTATNEEIQEMVKWWVEKDAAVVVVTAEKDAVMKVDADADIVINFVKQ